jgi:hypothetical protein
VRVFERAAALKSLCRSPAETPHMIKAARRAASASLHEVGLAGQRRCRQYV